jgi:uncharacterized protein (TIGR03663 family)
MSSRALVITIACLALLALALRVVRLDERPPHTDEAINAWILGRVLAGEPFAFDPRDRHGPLLPAAGLVVATILGRRSFADLDERTIRLAPALVGAAATGLFLLGTGLIPNGALAAGAALWAVSPLPLYFARYAIHETLLVAATLACLLMLVRAIAAETSRARIAWAVGAGVAAGTMLAAKLSAVIPLGAAAVALLAVWLLPSPRARGSTLLPAGALFGAAVVFTVTLAYSWGFTRLAGLHDLAFGLDAPLARAAGQGHEKGPFYFLSILGARASGVVFLVAAAAGAWVAWRRGGAIGRGLVVYAVVLFGVHSAIPYKTPWLALGIFLPLALLAGWAIAEALLAGMPRRGIRVGLPEEREPLADASARRPYLRAATYVGLTAFAALTVHADHRLVFAEPAAETNPFAYAHTSPDLRRLEPLVASLPAQNPLIAVYLEDAWPLPFLLRHHARVGYWQPGQTLPDAPDLLVTTPDLAASLDARFATWRPHYFSQRPGVMLVALQAPAAEVATP